MGCSVSAGVDFRTVMSGAPNWRAAGTLAGRISRKSPAGATHKAVVLLRLRGFLLHDAGASEYGRKASGDSEVIACKRLPPVRGRAQSPTLASVRVVSGKYAFRTYCSTIRWVLKNEPLRAIADRMTSAYANGSP